MIHIKEDGSYIYSRESSARRLQKLFPLLVSHAPFKAAFSLDISWSFSAGLIPLKSEVVVTPRCPDRATCVKMVLLELDSILHVLFHCFFFAVLITPKEVPMCLSGGLDSPCILHADFFPWAAVSCSTALIDGKNSCTRSDQKCNSCSALSLQPMPDVWGGEYRPAINKNVIIIILWVHP